jgi:hypothetical protein
MGLARVVECQFPPRIPEPEWRNWQTRETQNLVGFTARVGSIPSSGTNRINDLRQRWLSRAMARDPFPYPVASVYRSMCLTRVAELKRP